MTQVSPEWVWRSRIDATHWPGERCNQAQVLLKIREQRTAEALMGERWGSLKRRGHPLGKVPGHRGWERELKAISASGKPVSLLFLGLTEIFTLPSPKSKTHPIAMPLCLPTSPHVRMVVVISSVSDLFILPPHLPSPPQVLRYLPKPRITETDTNSFVRSPKGGSIL